MSDRKPLVSVIIASRNCKHFLKRNLDSVLKENGSFEVILVDDCSSDGTTDFVQKRYGAHDNVSVIFLSIHSGVAKARNIGAIKAKGKYLFFLDSDTKVSPGWVKTIHSFFTKHPKIGLAQAKILTMNTNKYDYAGDYMGPFGFLIERARSAEDTGQFDEASYIFSGKSAAMIVRKDVFKKVKGFDEDYTIFWEDTDLAWRVWLEGYEVFFLPQVTVWHAYGTREKDGKMYVSNRVEFHGCKNNLSSLVKNLSLKHLLTVLPVNFACWTTLGFLSLIKLNLRRGIEIFAGLGWFVLHFPLILKKRKAIQSVRKVRDEVLFGNVGASKELTYYIGKGLAYLQNKPF